MNTNFLFIPAPPSPLLRIRLLYPLIMRKRHSSLINIIIKLKLEANRTVGSLFALGVTVSWFLGATDPEKDYLMDWIAIIKILRIFSLYILEIIRIIKFNF